MANTSKSKKKKDEVVTKKETKKTPIKVVKTKEKSDSIKKEEIVKEEVNLEKIETPKKSHGMYIGLPLRIMGRVLLVLLLISFGTYLLLKTIYLESGKSVSYTEKSNIDYSVCLNNNSFYETNCLPKNMKYVASLINKIQVKFDYNFDIDEKTDIDFKYNIDGKLVIKDKSGKSFYEKDYELLKEKELKSNDKNARIYETLDIDYNKYNDVANSFKSAYGLDTESYLIVTMKIKKDSLNEDSKFSISSDSDMYLTIPLSERAIDVELNFVDINRKSNMIVRERLVLKNTLYLVVAGFSIFMGLYVMIMTMRKYRVPDNNKVYDAYIKKLLREYDRLIAESKTIISFEDKEVIKVNTFNELLDIHDNLTLPIMYYNVTSHVKSYFYIAHQNIVYLYTVKASDLEITKKK